MKYLLILVLPLLITLSSCHFFRERGLFLNREKALREINTQEKLVTADTLKTSKDTLMQARMDSQLVTSVVNTAAGDAGSSDQMFRIIVGSFGNLKNAEIAVDKYRKQGYNAEIVKPENKNNTMLISVFTFDSREKADQQLQVVKNTLDKDAWIYWGKSK